MITAAYGITVTLMLLMTTQGYKLRNAYIAAQAPLRETVGDFWRMIWEFKSKAILMLCNLEENGQVWRIRFSSQALLNDLL